MARDIHLEGFRTEESKGLFSLAKDMISSWMEKPQEKSTAVWLGEEFIQRVGGMTVEAAQELSSSIMDGVDQFTENMNAIEETYRSGGTKETWLQQKLLSVPGATEEERARYLAEAQVALAAGNNEVYAALHDHGQSADLRLPAEIEERVLDGAGGASWQPIPAQVVAQGVAEQAVLAGVGGAALDTGLTYAETQDGESLNTGIDLGDRSQHQGGRGGGTLRCRRARHRSVPREGDAAARAHEHCLLGCRGCTHRRAGIPRETQCCGGSRPCGTHRLRRHRRPLLEGHWCAYALCDSRRRTCPWHGGRLCDQQPVG